MSTPFFVFSCVVGLLLVYLPETISFGLNANYITLLGQVCISKLSYVSVKNKVINDRYSKNKFVFLSTDDDYNENDDDDDDEDEMINLNLSEQDWRTFRAKLVMGEAAGTETDSRGAISQSMIDDDGDLDGIGAIFSSTEDSTEQKLKTTKQGLMTPLDPSQWAYDSGKVIEQGAVILGGVEQDYGFGLRQQYFHKAAILVLHHDDKFTKGIILNRPTDLTLDDDINYGMKWRLWFGGDVQGFNSDSHEIVCLHSLKNDQAISVSITVMKDIRYTTFESAKRLVKIGVAKPTDFWVFSGYAGWGPNQLMGELERKSWYMVATDSQTLLKELARQSAGADPRDAGLETWILLMNMIGRSETARECTGNFDDLMLKEWAHSNLLSRASGGGANELFAVSQNDLTFRQKIGTIEASLAKKLKAGMILRAAPQRRSHFLLSDQEFHKSVVLVISCDASICIGAILSRPVTKGVDVLINEKNNKVSRNLQIPIRYGGQYALKGSETILWLHCKDALKASHLGYPIGNADGVWKCTADDVKSAIARGVAKAQDFMAVSGVYIWAREQNEKPNTSKSEKFEIVPERKVLSVFEELVKQEVLSASNLDYNLHVANRAWTIGKQNDEATIGNEEDDTIIPISGLGEGFDEEDDNFVFKSDVKVSKLCDDALRSWISTFLLGAIQK